MSENAAGRHLAVGAGAPADPDHLANGLTGAVTDGTAIPDGDRAADAEARLPSPDDAVQAVTDFVEDLVEDLDTPSDSDDE